MTNPAALLLGKAPEVVLLRHVVGHVLRQLREERGWTGAVLGKKMKLSPAAISKMEAGSTQLSVSYVWLFSECFDISAEDFMLKVEKASAELERQGIEVCTRRRGE